MKILNLILKNEVFNDEEKFLKIIKEIISYNNIIIDEKMFFSSTAYYSVKYNDEYIFNEAFPLKILIPDSILENFSNHDSDKKKLIIDFLKIFISKIIYLTYKIKISKNIHIYSSSIKAQECNLFNNKMDLTLLFRRYFSETLKIYENIPKKIKNNKPFILGKNQLFSNINQNNCIVGESFYSFVNRFLVIIDIHYFELDNLKHFFKIIGVKNRFLVFSNQKMSRNKTYKFKFIFEKDKCISAYSLPNFEEQIFNLESA